MRVVVPPGFVGSRLVRVVAAVPSLLEVEEWMGEWWEPSTVTLSDATAAPTASAEALDAAGVPAGDRVVDGERFTTDTISTLLTAPVQLNVGSQLNSLEKKFNGGRRRNEYAGSAKFGRRNFKNRRESKDAAEQPWAGPFRRATDPQRHVEGPPA